LAGLANRRIIRAAVALLIENPETERLVEELARRTGHSPAEVVAEAVREQLQRRPSAGAPSDPPDIWEQVREIQDELAALPDVDTRSADELIGYDEHGIPG
jgi:antitoxin VapB